MKMQWAKPPKAVDIVNSSVSDTVEKIGSVHADNLRLCGYPPNPGSAVQIHHKMDGMAIHPSES